MSTYSYKNDPNVQVHALVKCKNFDGGIYARCLICPQCCNNDLCAELRAQEEYKKAKEKKTEEKKVTQVIYDESHHLYSSSLDHGIYIGSREPTPSPISYTMRDYILRFSEDY